MEMTPNSLVQLAQRLATDAHAGQFRRGSNAPFIEHPRAVASRVGDDLDAQAVAWLHDVVEDSDHTAGTLLKAGIPAQLVDAVMLLTKERGDDYDDYLERVASSPLAAKVKIADLISNLADNPTEAQIRKYSKALVQLTCESQTARPLKPKRGAASRQR
jgi:(p)ppGpp synthase/HD superfamily hydrolase